MNPLIPHFTAECLESLNEKQARWPVVLEEDLIEKDINFVVQINGKKRALLKIPRNLDEKTILKKIKSNIETKKYFDDQKIKKTIFVSNRLINIII